VRERGSAAEAEKVTLLVNAAVARNLSDGVGTGERVGVEVTTAVRAGDESGVAVSFLEAVGLCVRVLRGVGVLDRGFVCDFDGFGVFEARGVGVFDRGVGVRVRSLVLDRGGVIVFVTNGVRVRGTGDFVALGPAFLIGVFVIRGVGFDGKLIVPWQAVKSVGLASLLVHEAELPVP
jgi:hypothetical protein